MKNKYSVEGIKINYDVDTKDYPPFVVDKIEEFFVKVQKEKIPWKVIEDLQKLIVKFPNVPVFKNYLATAYEKLNREDHLINILLRTVEEHPEYSLARITLSKFYVDRGEIELAENTFKYTNNISELFPEQKIFHYTEVQYFYYILALIELEKSNFKNTEEIVELLNSLDIDDQFLNDINRRLMHSRLANFPDFLTNDDISIEPIPKKVIVKDSSKKQPVLQNAVLYKIYTEELYLANDILEEIQSLERNSIINDLRMILKDAENRYHYFSNSDIKFQYFPIHALLLFRELNAEEALEDILDFLRNDEDFLEFWLGDFITEHCWEIIFSLSQNKLIALKNFLLESGVYSFSKGAVLSAMEQISFSDKSDVKAMWKECLEFYNAATEEDNVISVDFFSLFVGEIFTFDKEYFKEGIKNLYDKGWIDEMMIGSFEELYNDDFIPYQKDIHDLSAIYQQYIN